MMQEGGQHLEAGEGKETDSPPDPSEKLPCQRLDSVPTEMDRVLSASRTEWEENDTVLNHQIRGHVLPQP